jgi:hypothetical protein
MHIHMWSFVNVYAASASLGGPWFPLLPRFLSCLIIIQCSLVSIGNNGDVTFDVTSAFAFPEHNSTCSWYWSTPGVYSRFCIGFKMQLRERMHLTSNGVELCLFACAFLVLVSESVPPYLIVCTRSPIDIYLYIFRNDSLSMGLLYYI